LIEKYKKGKNLIKKDKNILQPVLSENPLEYLAEQNFRRV